jgi:hypothetical protein
MEITVKEMKASDEFTIRTESSDYSFRIIDPAQSRGVLRGSRLGTEHEAIFIETIPSSSCTTHAPGQLRPGDRAVFLVGSDIVKRLTTSIISEIAFTEASEATPDDC